MGEREPRYVIVLQANRFGVNAARQSPVKTDTSWWRARTLRG